VDEWSYFLPTDLLTFLVALFPLECSLHGFCPHDIELLAFLVLLLLKKTVVRNKSLSCGDQPELSRCGDHWNCDPSFAHEQNNSYSHGFVICFWNPTQLDHVSSLRKMSWWCSLWVGDLADGLSLVPSACSQKQVSCEVTFSASWKDIHQLVVWQFFGHRFSVGMIAA
jgi:hypothetical protein